MEVKFIHIEDFSILELITFISTFSNTKGGHCLCNVGEKF